MNARIVILGAAALLAGACGRLPVPETLPIPLPGSDRDEPPPVVAGYAASWKTGPDGARLASLDASRITHVLYAFGAIDSTGRARLGDPCADVGRCAAGADTSGGDGAGGVGPADGGGVAGGGSAGAGTAGGGAAGAGSPDAGGNFAQLAALKRRHPHLRVLIAIGGWTGSGRFSDVAQADSSRKRFATSVIDVFLAPDPRLFDGVDIDWEYPVHGGLAANARRPEDRRNFTLLLAELRRQLDSLGRAEGRRYLLTAATGAGRRAVEDLELAQVAGIVDWLNVMAYDYHAGEPRASFNAPLYATMTDPTPGSTVDATLRRYLDAGVPRDRLVLGVPFYARVLGGVAPENDGLYQAADSAPPPPWSAAVDQRELARLDPGARGFRRFRDDVARVPWLYDPATRVWITYEDAQSVGEKGAFARRHALRGVVAWELMSDDGWLLPALARAVATDPD